MPSTLVDTGPDGPAGGTWAQGPAELQKQPHPLGSVHGLVVDGAGSVYEGATVTLVVSGSSGPAARSTPSGSDGRFNFSDALTGPFQLTVTSTGFKTQSMRGVLHPGENYDAKAIVLTMNGTSSEVQVKATEQDIAAEEVKIEETQRVFGIIPNFYVTYVPNAPPLTAKQKFDLALRTTIDPVTFLAAGVFAGAEQAANSYSGFGQGAQGYAKRFGANYADGFTGTMIGSAILPAWWKQDPRYFYQGTGTTRSRVFHALASAVICKGDNGRWQPNYSSIIGGLAAGGISNLYYPASNRNGAGLTFENAAVSTALAGVQNLFQEFVVKKLTPKIPNYGTRQ